MSLKLLHGIIVGPSPLNCKNEYLMFAPEKVTAAEAVVKPKTPEMSARSCVLHSVRTQLTFPFDPSLLLKGSHTVKSA